MKNIGNYGFESRAVEIERAFAVPAGGDRTVCYDAFTFRLDDIERVAYTTRIKSHAGWNPLQILGQPAFAVALPCTRGQVTSPSRVPRVDIPCCF